MLVPEDEGDFNDTSEADGHQGLAKCRVRHGTDHQLLRMSRHGPTSDENHEARNEVTLGVAVAVPAEPHARQARAPPDNPHSRVLPVILDPSRAPTMFGEGVDATPGSDHSTVKKFLRTPTPLHPYLSDEQNDGQDDTVGDEGASHDEVGCALPNVFPLTEAKGCDAAKDHLSPRHDGHRLPDDGVAWSDELSDLAIHTLLPMSPQVKPQNNLPDEKQLQDVGKD